MIVALDDEVPACQRYSGDEAGVAALENLTLLHQRVDVGDELLELQFVGEPPLSDGTETAADNFAVARAGAEELLQAAADASFLCVGESFFEEAAIGLCPVPSSGRGVSGANFVEGRRVVRRQYRGKRSKLGD